MKVEVLGQIKYISEPKEVKGEEDHKFVSVWLKTLEDYYIAVNAWDEHIEQLKGLAVGSIVTFKCRIESHRNKKNPALFYHKILLT